jgi:hypothetical protein
MKNKNIMLMTTAMMLVSGLLYGAAESTRPILRLQDDYQAKRNIAEGILSIHNLPMSVEQYVLAQEHFNQAIQEGDLVSAEAYRDILLNLYFTPGGGGLSDAVKRSIRSTMKHMERTIMKALDEKYK